ncbi:MAG TPA: NnrS family protein [Casimicrobiaceae bacterium]
MVFFPVAAAYAIFVLPASVCSMLGMIAVFPGVATPAGHAHEMLFGFALAVVAGNQLGPRTRSSLALLVALWLAARVAFLFFPGGALADGANVAFPALLAWHLAPRLFGSAKKWRNQSLPAVLTAICGSAIVYLFVARNAAASVAADFSPYRVLLVAVSLFALLLLFMGGRLIAPVVAGQLHRQGIHLAARVQPRIEAALIIAMLVATLAIALDGTPRGAQEGWAARAAGVALIVAGLLAALRMARWQLWLVRGRADVLCLAAGYAWLAVGLVLLGAAHAGVGLSRYHETIALHVITIGSLGTLTLNVMAMTWLLRARRNPASTRLPVLATLLLALATALRAFAGGAVLEPEVALLAASLCWSGAFALLLILLLNVDANRGSGHAPD